MIRNSRRIDEAFLAEVRDVFKEAGGEEDEEKGFHAIEKRYRVGRAQVKRYFRLIRDGVPPPGSQTHGAYGSPSGHAYTEEQRTSLAITRAIGQYLDQCLNGGSPTAVSLGRAGASADPEVIREHAKELANGLDRLPAIQRVKTVQRIRELNAAADRFESSVGPEAVFVEHGKQWAEENGIEYATFRDCGVPARVLRAAGMSWASSS